MKLGSKNLLAFTLAGAFLSPVLLAQTEAQEVNQKLYLVQKLFEKVKSSSDSKVVGEQILEAEKYIDKGEIQSAKQLLDRSLKQLAVSYRNRSSDSKSMDHQENRYGRRLTQVNSLYDALNQDLLKPGKRHASSLHEIDYQKRIEQAEEHRKGQEYSLAMAQLDTLYHKLADALILLKDNQTIEYRLNFDSPQEEYEYEVKRFDTHIMLIKMRLSETVLGEEKKGRVDQLIYQAHELVDLSIHQSEKENYVAAIQTRENATSKLVQALQQLGLYIPK